MFRSVVGNDSIKKASRKAPVAMNHSCELDDDRNSSRPERVPLTERYLTDRNTLPCCPSVELL